MGRQNLLAECTGRMYWPNVPADVAGKNYPPILFGQILFGQSLRQTS
jgi:hypothetical protein